MRSINSSNELDYKYDSKATRNIHKFEEKRWRQMAEGHLDWQGISPWEGLRSSTIRKDSLRTQPSPLSTESTGVFFQLYSTQDSPPWAEVFCSALLYFLIMRHLEAIAKSPLVEGTHRIPASFVPKDSWEFLCFLVLPLEETSPRCIATLVRLLYSSLCPSWWQVGVKGPLHQCFSSRSSREGCVGCALFRTCTCQVP